MIRPALYLLTTLITLAPALRADSNFYDDSGRLIRSIHPEGTATLYTYDPADNLLSVTSTAVPKAPGDLLATRDSETTAQLTWVDRSSTENGFSIERRTAKGYNWIFVTSLAANTTSYTDTDLDPDTNYVYRVFALSTPPRTSAYSSESAAAGEDSGAFSIRSLVKNGATLELRFDTSTGPTYTIETSPSLETPVWSTLSFSTTPAGPTTHTSVTGTGGPAVIYFAPDGLRRFYRLVRTP